MAGRNAQRILPSERQHAPTLRVGLPHCSVWLGTRDPRYRGSDGFRHWDGSDGFRHRAKVRFGDGFRHRNVAFSDIGILNLQSAYVLPDSLLGCSTHGP
jgi:hypothetical protein